MSSGLSSPSASAALVTIVGEPGVGKSRLVAELVARVGTDARVVRGTCLSYGEGITYWAIGQIVRDLARISDEQSPAEARDRIAAVVGTDPAGEAVARKVAQLLGLADGSATAEATADAIRDFLAAGAGAQPLVVVVDDIQWAEPTLLDLLAALPAGLRNVPVLLLCLARPELAERRPDWEVALRLEPFAGHDVDALLEALLGTAPADVRVRLAAASAGNPLFVEELVAMLEDEGVLRVAHGICTLDGDLDELALPVSLHALLGARLDRLEPRVRATLERGAIEGEVFHRGAIVELSPPSCACDRERRSGGPRRPGSRPSAPRRASPARPRSASSTSCFGTPRTSRRRRGSARSCTSSTPTGSRRSRASA